MIKGLYKKREWYYWQPAQVRGVRMKPVALKTKDENEATSKVLEIIKHGEVDTSTKTRLEAVIADYLKEKNTTRQHCAQTTDHSRKVLSRFSDFLENIDIQQISEKVVLTYRQNLIDRDLKQSSIQTYMRVIKVFFSWCVKNRVVRENPLQEYVIGRSKKTRRQEVCTLEQQLLLLQDPPSREVELILYLGFYAGLRFNEMLAFEKDWLWINDSYTKGSISIQETTYFKPKSREMRTIPLHPKLLSFLARYGMQEPFMLAPYKREWPTPPRYRFNPKKQFKTWTLKCGIKKCTYHTLRHTFATQLAQQGSSLMEIAQLLGDTLSVTEQHYVAYLPNAASAISKLK